jgi:hypothetical protein
MKLMMTITLLLMMGHLKQHGNTLTNGGLPISRMHSFKNSMIKKISFIVVMNGMINQVVQI